MSGMGFRRLDASNIETCMGMTNNEDSEAY